MTLPWVNAGEASDQIRIRHDLGFCGPGEGFEPCDVLGGDVRLPKITIKLIVLLNAQTVDFGSPHASLAYMGLWPRPLKASFGLRRLQIQAYID